MHEATHKAIEDATAVANGEELPIFAPLDPKKMTAAQKRSTHDRVAIRPKDYKRSRFDLLRIADMIAVGASAEQIAGRLEISVNTLRDNYEREMLKLGMKDTGRHHVPTDRTRKQVFMLSTLGTSKDRMAKFMGVTVNTLMTHYEREVEEGLLEANVRVSANMLRMATGDDGKTSAIAGMFWLKTRAGFKETSVNEVTGPDGQPLQPNPQQFVVVLPSNGRETPGTPLIEGSATDA